jgi:hypothetical protein
MSLLTVDMEKSPWFVIIGEGEWDRPRGQCLPIQLPPSLCSEGGLHSEVYTHGQGPLGQP